MVWMHAYVFIEINMWEDELIDLLLTHEIETISGTTRYCNKNVTCRRRVEYVDDIVSYGRQTCEKGKKQEDSCRYGWWRDHMRIHKASNDYITLRYDDGNDFLGMKTNNNMCFERIG